MRSFVRNLACAAAIVAASVAPLVAAAPGLGIKLACTNSGTTCTIVLSGLTNGSALAVLLSQPGADASSTFTISDGAVNTYTAWAPGLIHSNGGRGCTMWLATNITTTAGALTPVVTRTSPTGITFRALAVELTGAATSSAVDVTGSSAENGTSTSHPSATSPLSTLTDVFLLGWSGGSNAHATYAAATDFTSLTTEFATTSSTAQYLSTSSARAAETATWTNSGLATEDANCLIAIKSPTSAASAAHRIRGFGLGF